MKTHEVPYEIKYILWDAALLVARDVVQNSGQGDGHLGFYAKLEFIEKVRSTIFFILDS